MIKIRKGVFETNSSSVHSMTMCSDDEYKKLLSGELLVGKYSGGVFTREEALKSHWNYNPDKKYTEEQIDRLVAEEYAKFEDYGDDSYFEYFEDSYTLPDGQEVYAFGLYGRYG